MFILIITPICLFFVLALLSAFIDHFSSENKPVTPKGQISIGRWKGSLFHVKTIVKDSVVFEYVDGKGKRSAREVDVKEVVEDSRGRRYLRGICHKSRDECISGLTGLGKSVTRN